MKLKDLGLAQKPQTKYFDGGYVSFSTVENKLHYAIHVVNKRGSYLLVSGNVTNKKQLDNLLSAKTVEDVELWA